MLVAVVVVVLAAAVVGALVWWLRRDPVGGGDSGRFEAERKWGWEFLLGPEAEAAFLEGLRAYHEAGGALRVDAEEGVLTTYEPPRLISLHLLADAFAARGDAAMHDPQGTVATLMDQLASAERPGVLHLRPGWLEGEVDGMDAAAFAAAVGEVVGGAGGGSAGERSGEAGIGALHVAVPGAGPVAEGVLSHVNGTPLKTVSKDAAAGAPEPPAPERAKGEANTLMLDLGKVLDLYLEARKRQPDADAGALLREVVPALIAAGGPGLTWTKPPTPAELRAALGTPAAPRAAGGSPAPRGSADGEPEARDTAEDASEPH
ncbi:hypothetical protein [Nonomuraea sp. KM90]|uniref:hypothetical protein n=1 Tax=Nonomuraea sp. KM90 TaxID=3457428 RepID=UPI003FCE248B